MAVNASLPETLLPGNLSNFVNRDRLAYFAEMLAFLKHRIFHKCVCYVPASKKLINASSFIFFYIITLRFIDTLFKEKKRLCFMLLSPTDQYEPVSLTVVIVGHALDQPGL